MLSGSRNYLGKPDPLDTEDGLLLSPVYEFRTVLAPNGNLIRQVVPVLFYPVKQLRVYGGRIEVNDLPAGEVEILKKSVDACEEAMVHIREQQTGIVAARQLTDVGNVSLLKAA